MDWLSTLISWLNSNAGVVTTLATVVIAIASLISSRIISLQKSIERANRMPVLTFVERVEAARSGSDQSESARGWRSVYVENVGYGPALNIVRKIVTKVERIPGIEPNECLAIGALGSGDETSAFVTTQKGDYSTSLLDLPELWIVVECDDILGRHYEGSYRNRSYSTRPIPKRKMPPDQAARI
jgi:hypothetical protein